MTHHEPFFPENPMTSRTMFIAAGAVTLTAATSLGPLFMSKRLFVLLFVQSMLWFTAVEVWEYAYPRMKRYAHLHASRPPLSRCIGASLFFLLIAAGIAGTAATGEPIELCSGSRSACHQTREWMSPPPYSRFRRFFTPKAAIYRLP